LSLRLEDSIVFI